MRNVKPLWSTLGPVAVARRFGGLDMWITTLFGGCSPFGTMKHGKTDAEATGAANRFEPIVYPKPDGVLASTG